MTEAARPKLLVLDDEPLMRRAVRVALTDAGFDVIECGDGDTATLLVERHRVDAVLFEYHVPPYAPEMFVRGLRARHPELIVIACCGHLSTPRVRELIDAGADGYLAKIDLSFDLVPLLETLLQRRGASRSAVKDQGSR